jgi:hypothetical protein
MDSYEISVCEIVARVACRRVSPHQRLYQDLGLSGDDMMEIFAALSERFGTRFAALQFEEYFPDESEGLTDRIEGWVGLARNRKVLTIRHLSAVAQRGEWFEPLES